MASNPHRLTENMERMEAANVTRCLRCGLLEPHECLSEPSVILRTSAMGLAAERFGAGVDKRRSSSARCPKPSRRRVA